jgi:NADPH:quinone reductase-like Zn-dependent oxidoreductase
MEKLAVARSRGADELIDYKEESIRGRVRALTDGKGADVVYDPVGGDAFDQALHAVDWEARMPNPGSAAQAGRGHALRSVAVGNGSQRTCMGLFPVKRLFLGSAASSLFGAGRPFFIPSPAIRFPERAEGVKGPKR